MSQPLENNELRRRGDVRLIDQLVDAELPDNERRELLLRLESEPDGWRHCALAFLEAQSWSQAFGPLAATGRPDSRLVLVGKGRHRKRRRWSLARLSALAAGFALVFALGWGLHRGPTDNSVPAPNMRTEASPSTPFPQSVDSTPVELAQGQSRAPESARSTLPDEVAQLWEQRGYQTERESRVISMELKDGRRLDMPIEEVRVQYIGDRTY
jgi:anti-sigma factor RsiW